MSGAGIGGTLGTALGVALAPETGGLSLMIPAAAGAAGSALGGEFTGSKNIWRDALLGGVGGLAGGALGGAGGLGDLFGGSTSAATAAGTDAASSGLGSLGAPLADSLSSSAPAAQSALSSGIANPLWQSSLSAPALSTFANAGADAVAPAASSGLLGSIGKFAPYAALSGGAMLLDGMNQPTQVGPTPQQHPSNPGQVSPLSRQAQAVDPNSYYSPSTAVNRSYYSPYTLQPQFMKNGGRIRYFANGGSSSASSSNIPPTRSRHIKGAGDGRSDQIPAMLSDAGAKKLDKMQKNVLQKNYKGGKPPRSYGIGGYVH